MRPQPLAMIVPLSVLLVLVVLGSAHAAAQAGQVVGDGHNAATMGDAGAEPLHKPSLNTYNMSASSPQIDVVGPGRPDTTRIRLQLKQHQTSSFMPIVSADAAKGLTHNVVNTWKFLQHYALQSKLVRAFNDKHAGTNTPLRYPVAANSIHAASALLPSGDAVSGVAASRHLLRTAEPAQDYTHTAPTNVLLLAGGASVAAVADILSVDAVGASPDAGGSVTLDVVHAPGQAVSEFEAHAPQTLDRQAHYHFFTPAGVRVDAARFLALVKGSAQALPDLHIFAKGTQCTGQDECNTDQKCDGVLEANDATCEAPGGCDTQNTCTCIYAPAQDTVVCRQATECTVATTCDGTNTGCPDAAPDNEGGSCAGPDGCADATCQAGECVCPVIVDPTPEPEPEPGTNTTCTPGQLCRHAASHCHVAVVCPATGICPPSAAKTDGAWCPWYPPSHDRYGRYSVDVSSMRPTKASAQEATARLSSGPAYYKERGWPTCEGTCISGSCALKWDHPACCRVGGGHGYAPYASQEGEARAASDNSHIHRDGDHLCWGY